MTDRELAVASAAYLRERLAELRACRPETKLGCRGLAGAIAELVQCIRDLGGSA